MNNYFEYFITKYALTKGIITDFCKLVPGWPDFYISKSGKKYGNFDCWTKEKDAVSRANLMRNRKIKTLYRKINESYGVGNNKESLKFESELLRLKNLNFEVKK